MDRHADRAAARAERSHCEPDLAPAEAEPHRDLEPKLPPNRYEHASPGDMVHFDIKRLVRIQRPSHRLPAIAATASRASAPSCCTSQSTTTRIAFTAMYPDQKESSATHFLAQVTA